MPDSNPDTPCSDGTTIFSGEKPRVQLPRSRPKVNLPPNSSPSLSTPIPSNSYYATAAEPSVETLDNYFPYLGAPAPHVNIPLNAQRHVRYPSNEPQATSCLESQLRGMILRNEVPQGHITQPNSCGQGQNPNQSLSQRPNQTQRRQQAFQVHSASTSNPSFHFQTTRQVPPHLRGLFQHEASRTNLNHPKQPSFAEHQPASRSPAPHRQLYNPNVGSIRQNNHLRANNPRVSIQAQDEYLDRLAVQEIPRVEISREEFAQKHALRSSLEVVCRKSVTAYEIQKNINFIANAVELKCFGSLSTTFATRSSDMDLVLLSPQSKPALSLPESEIPRLVETALLDCGFGARLLTKTRVPIIRFCEKPSENLVNLLKEERLKWETEMAAALTQPKAKKKHKQKKTDPEVSDATKTQDSPNSVHANGREPAKDTSSLATNIKDETLPTPETEAGSKNNVPNRDVTILGPTTKQGDDITLLGKADAELISLYKLAMHEGWYDPAERKTITAFIRIAQNRNAPEQEIATARSRLKELPNIIGRYRAPPEPHRLDFPKDGVGIQCDINFSNLLALHNSQLLRCYSLCDPRVRLMVLFVKAWSKRRKINSAYHGTLSSYGYVLMVLHYLVNIALPPVVPNLQLMPQAFEDELSIKETVLDGHNIRFFRNETAIEDLRQRKGITSNAESVGSLLRGFFHYYAQTGYSSPAGGFQWTQDVLSLRTGGGILSKQTKGWTGAKTEKIDISGPGPTQTKEVRQRYLFAIEDPFEIEHNVARTVVHNGIVAIRDEFRRAHRLIENAGVMPGKGEEALFTEAEDKENLQYRAFGPRPRKDNGAAKEIGKDEKSAPMSPNADSAGGAGP